MLSGEVVRSLVGTLSKLTKSTSAVDPSSFLRALQHKISVIKNAPFNINSQQDVPEILQVVLDELCGPSVVANDIASSTITSTTSCNTFFLSSRSGRKFFYFTTSCYEFHFRIFEPFPKT